MTSRSLALLALLTVLSPGQAHASLAPAPTVLIQVPVDAPCPADLRMSLVGRWSGAL